MSMLHIGIIGATGYTGVELLKLLQRHPAAQIAWLTSESNAGQCFGKVFPVPPPLSEMPLIPLAQADYSAADVVFACLPHATAQVPVADAVEAGAKVIDLSADYRLHDVATYEAWYGVTHNRPVLLAEAVYGLPELHRAEIAAARLVANPGCYPTSVILGLAPLARAGWLSGTVIADSKSGVSGAGRQLSLKTHFVEANENLSPYSIGRIHRHLAEMEQEIQGACEATAGSDGTWQLIFSPHLLPVNRGILSTIYVTLPEGVRKPKCGSSIRPCMPASLSCIFCRQGRSPRWRTVSAPISVRSGLTFVPGSRTLIVTASIDNLIKGASGQAVQNMNIMFGFDEQTALR